MVPLPVLLIQEKLQMVVHNQLDALQSLNQFVLMMFRQLLVEHLLHGALWIGQHLFILVQLAI